MYLDYIDQAIVDMFLGLFLLYIIFILTILFQNFLAKFLRSIFNNKRGFYDK